MFKLKWRMCCLIVIVTICRYTRAFMEMDSTAMARAYVDAYFDNIEKITQKHINSTNKQYDSDLCYKQLKYLKNHLGKGDLWAIKG